MVAQQMEQMGFSMNTETHASFPIDAVITWVDGNDPVLAAKRNSFLPDKTFAAIDDIAGATRYTERGEIHWCIRSINKFMPWIRRIFIITDGQNPHIKSRIPVEIIDHSVIFRGYEQYLPMFCSVSIEAMMWRIPGLSEHFVYFNDDFLVCRRVSPEIFFPQEGHIKCHAHLASIWWTETRYFVKRLFGHSRRVNHVRRMMAAARITGSRNTFIRLSHTPYPMLKSTMQLFYEQHPERLEQNLRNRFRSTEHFRNDELVYMLLRKKGCLQIAPVHDVLMEYMPHGGIKRLERKLRRVTRPGSQVCFICFGSLDKATDDIFLCISNFVEELLKE